MISSAEELLDLRSVSKAYHLESRDFLAVSDINLQIKAGEFVCLLGPSGCGKSTLLRIIAGLNAATSGVVSYHGQPLKGVNPYATIVFQTFALYPWLTVQQNVEIALKARGISGAVRAERAIQLIDVVGLDGFETAYPRELSGGMRQKVGFARAMAVEPELLCLDEPFSALDVLSAEALRGELMELWLKKKIPTKAILMVTHNIEEAVLMADRIVVMGKEPGHIVSEIAITLHHPRQRKDTAFQDLIDRVYAAVAGHTLSKDQALGTQPGQPGKTRPLPDAPLNAVAGLLEKLVESGGRVDLSRMGSSLSLELDDLLPIIEAADALGFAAMRDGELQLTPLGRAYADATILARKAIIAGRVLRFPVIAWIYEILQRDDNQRVAWDYFHQHLQADFGDQADRQLHIAINWGRQAELFAYDDNSEELFLDRDEGARAQKTFVLADLYEAWPVLSTEERIEGFKLLQQSDAEDFFLHLSAKDKAQLTLALPAGQRKTWIRLLAEDEAANLIQAADKTERTGLLALLDDKAHREVAGLLDYAEQQGSGRLNPAYASLRPQMSIDEAVSFLRKDAQKRAATIYYAYVIDADERLLGVVSFRDLLTNPGDKMIRDVMRTDVVTAPMDVDRAALDQLFAKYQLQMIPLVDPQTRIARIVKKPDADTKFG